MLSMIRLEILALVGDYSNDSPSIEDLNWTIIDYLDLYLIHSAYGGKTIRLEAWKALLAAKKEGKLKSVGVSN